MKIGIISDIHLGINENKPYFLDYQLKCVNHIYSEFKKIGIKDIIYLGDVFDKRYSISVKTLKVAEELFNNNFNQHFLLGNHDITYKNSNELNSVQILLGKKNKVYVDDPGEIEFSSKKFLIVPWINKSNINNSVKVIKESKADYCLGHFDLQGFEMIRGIESKSSLFKTSILENFDLVVSGHYHCYSNKQNITYLGSVCEMNWNDYNVKKYCGYIDTDTDELNLIDIPYTMYDIIRIKDLNCLDSLDSNSFTNKIIKCYLYITRGIKVEKFINKLDQNAFSVNVIDEMIINSTSNIDLDDSKMSVVDMWKSYLDELEMSTKDKTIINKIFSDVYIKVNSGETD